MTKTIIPRKEWVLVKPEEVRTQTQSGLLLPDTEEKEQKAQGEVVAVGDSVEGLKKGDIVIYGAYAGENMVVYEKGAEVEYKLLLDEDIIAFVK